MRQFRTLTALVAALTAALLLALTTGTGAASARTLPAHHIVVKNSGEYKSNHFYVKGFVTSAKGNKVFLMKGTKRSNMKQAASKRTSKNSGYFRINFTGKVGTKVWLLVKKTPYRRQTVKYIGRIVRG